MTHRTWVGEDCKIFIIVCGQLCAYSHVDIYVHTCQYVFLGQTEQWYSYQYLIWAKLIYSVWCFVYSLFSLNVMIFLALQSVWEGWVTKFNSRVWAEL